jgi:DNA polymerase IV
MMLRLFYVLRFTFYAWTIRWPDFTTPTRQLTLRQPTDEAETIVDAALRLFEQIWSRGQPVRLIGVSGLGTPPRRLSLWDLLGPEEHRQAKLRAAVDALHARFGTGSARREGERREEQG